MLILLSSSNCHLASIRYIRISSIGETSVLIDRLIKFFKSTFALKKTRASRSAQNIGKAQTLLNHSGTWRTKPFLVIVLISTVYMHSKHICIIIIM